MSIKSLIFGKTSEDDAARYLRKNGYKILERNYRTNLGEIDIIAKEKGVIVFVEVKARTSTRYGSPKQAVNPGKQKKISMTAQCWLKAKNQTGAKARFDVVTVMSENGEKQFELVRNAFDLAFR